MITTLDSNDMQIYERYAKRVGDFTPMMQPTAVKVKKPKPTCKEDIERCINNDMTQSEIAESICENWDVSRRTAYRLMTKYGFTRDKKTSAAERPDLAEVPTVQSASDVPLQVLLQSKNYEIKKLKEEIERLKKELENQR